MPKYNITSQVKSAAGWQMYSVVADNKDEALRKHKAGESEFVDEDVQVTSLGPPEVEEDTSE